MKINTILLALLLQGSTVVAQKNVLLVNSGKEIEAGIKLYEEEKYQESISKYDLVSKSDTNYVTALYEKALSCSALKRYAETVELAKQGIQYSSEHLYSFYNILGTTYDNMDSAQKSLYYLDEGLKLFPDYYLLHFNKGVTLLALKDDKAAFESFAKAVDLNFYHVGSHIQIGNLAYKYGMVAPALLSYQFALLLEPDSKRAMDCIGNMLTLAKGEEYPVEDKTKFISYRSGENDFSEVDQIILSKIALDKKYKTKSKIHDQVVNQMQVCMERLQTIKGDKGFWMTHYGWFFREIFEQDYFESFTYLVFSGLENDNVRRIVKSNAAKTAKFTAWAGNRVSDFMGKKTFTYEGKSYDLKHHYNRSGILLAAGNMSADGEKRVGPWFTFHTSGNLELAAAFTADGKRTGKWTWFYENGQVEEIAEYSNNEITGENLKYYNSGVLHKKQYFDNHSQLTGAYYAWYPTGQLMEQLNYKEGLREGAGLSFNENGSRAYELIFKEDNVSSYKSFHNNNMLEEEFTVVNKNREGAYTKHHANGQLHIRGNYKAGKAEGEWVYYYENGAVHQKGVYTDDKKTGTWNYYHDNGAFEFKEEYDENGKTHGNVKVYDSDSVLYYEYLYEKGRIKKYTFYDKKGGTLSAGQEKGGKLLLRVFYPDGPLESEGTIESGNREGQWVYYHRCGTVSSKHWYEKGEENGLRESFYKSGKIKNRCSMKDDSYDGYYTAYYGNGQVEKEGWYVSGQMQGDWYEYHENGKLSSANYYLNHEIYGFENYYNQGGEHNTIYEWKDGYTDNITVLDSTGGIVSKATFRNGSGPYRLLFANGKPKVTGSYRNGLVDSLHVLYYSNGNKWIEENFRCNSREGTFTRYDESGKVSQKGNYSNNKRTGVWEDYTKGRLEVRSNYFLGELNGTRTWYYENGKPELYGEYRDGDRSGWFMYYEPGGMLRFRVRYIEGSAQGYSYLGADGKFVPEIPLNNGNAKMKAFFQNGTVSVECEYKSGTLNGRRTVYHANGKPYTEDDYTDGNLQGVSKEYYANGKLKVSAIYLQDELDGLRTTYYEDGKEESVENYVIGKKYGLCRYFDATGKLLREQTYHYDE